MAPARTSHLPLKVNMAGVIPAIFASSIILFPASITQWFGQSEGFEWLFNLSQLLQPGQPLYVVLFTMAVIFLLSFIQECSIILVIQRDNLKKSGVCTRLPDQANKHLCYIDKVMTRLTHWCVIYCFCLFGSLHHYVVMEGAIPIRWYIIIDCSGCYYGFHRTGSESFNVSTI